MWKTYSIKKQLALILLIPVSGIIFITVMHIKTTLKEFDNINQSIESINTISKLSKGIILISDERGINNYAYYDASQKKELEEAKVKTNDWFLKADFKNPIISSNLKSLHKLLSELHSDIQNNAKSPSLVYIQYSNYTQILEQLIENEIVNSKYPKLTLLANNYNNYIFLKRAVLLKRGVVLRKLINVEKQKVFSESLYELYIKSKAFDDKVAFNINNFGYEDINKELIELVESKGLIDYNENSDLIINDKLKMSPDKWWRSVYPIISKLNEIETKNLNYIENFAEVEKQKAIQSIILLFSILALFLIFTSIVFYKLTFNLSRSLNRIYIILKKISEGKIIGDSSLSGNSELFNINNSFNQLLSGIKGQVTLSKKIISGEYGAAIELRSPNDTVNKSLNAMSLELNKMHLESEVNNVRRANVSRINNVILESSDLKTLGKSLCGILVETTAACQATFYVVNNDENQLQKIGGFAEDKNSPESITIGEGLLGEVVNTKQQECYNDLPNHFSYLSSSLGKTPIYNLLITPITYKNDVVAVIEIGSLTHFNEAHKYLLNIISNSVGNTLEVFKRNEELKITLQEINSKNNVLQVQEEELRQSNKELNKHTLLLQQSEEELKNQAAELEQTNAYLEEKAKEIEGKNNEVEIKNSELVIAQEQLKQKADEIEKASQYKSEFLANMSHELRTPLNSILILSDILRENNSGNLTNPQIDNLSVINSSGKDLLNLITDILDISKIEAGKVEVYQEESVIERVFSDMDGLFRAQMERKNIEFTCSISEDCPVKLNTDIGKLEQIIKNFLSNALKFTPENGKVSLRFSAFDKTKKVTSKTLSKLNPNEILHVEIEDSGIGISDENKIKLFQSFQQADSSTSRKYGGTGLGLFISKEIAVLLGGEVGFESELNKGSVFCVCIPAIYQNNDSVGKNINQKAIEEKPINIVDFNPSTEQIVDLSKDINDDRDIASLDDKTILIIEDDASFAKVLMQVAHDNGFKAILAYQGETGFQYAKKYKPKAIILDMKLPGIDGWTVLKWLKEDKELQHIPVHVMSGMNREKLAKEMGAFDFLIKPITSEKLKFAFDSITSQINSIYKKVLILEDNVDLNYSIKELIHNLDRNVICVQAKNFNEAEEILKNEDIDCAIMDIGLPDSTDIKNIATLKKISKNKNINIIVNTGRELSIKDELELKNFANGIVIKTNNATNRLKDELTLFLDKVVETATDKPIAASKNLLTGDILKNKKILIVDDDIRNIYALSSALTSKGATILTAFNGIEALDALKINENIDIVLMDIMMPEMDGFEATRKIRENPKWLNLPIIALTAKAMKGDRDEVLSAGASDYHTKPIDIQQLISLISIWIYK